MTENDIERSIKYGISVYENTERGYEDFKEETIGQLNDAEDIPGMWEAMDVVGDYRVGFTL